MYNYNQTRLRSYQTVTSLILHITQNRPSVCKNSVFICKIGFLGPTQAAWPCTFSGSENNLIWQKCFMQIYLHKKSLNFSDYSKVVDRRQWTVPTFLHYYSRHHTWWLGARGNCVFSCSAVYLPTQYNVWQIGKRVPTHSPRTESAIACPAQVETDLNRALVRLGQDHIH